MGLKVRGEGDTLGLHGLPCGFFERGVVVSMEAGGWGTVSRLETGSLGIVLRVSNSFWRRFRSVSCSSLMVVNVE